MIWNFGCFIAGYDRNSYRLFLLGIEVVYHVTNRAMVSTMGLVLYAKEKLAVSFG